MFDNTEKGLRIILSRADSVQLELPDFQKDHVWDDDLRGTFGLHIEPLSGQLCNAMKKDVILNTGTKKPSREYKENAEIEIYESAK